jgi:hypothetical protein
MIRRQVRREVKLESVLLRRTVVTSQERNIAVPMRLPGWLDWLLPTSGKRAARIA